jgi:hypothetical protein
MLVQIAGSGHPPLSAAQALIDRRYPSGISSPSSSSNPNSPTASYSWLMAMSPGSA